MLLWETRRYLRQVRKLVWWRLCRYVRPVRPPKSGDGRIRLHIGCGHVSLPGFFNIDVVPLPHVHWVHWAWPLERFGDASVHLIYCSHVLEHLSFAEVDDALKEWNRVLVTGGTLRLAVPDFAALVDVYLREGDIGQIRGYLMGQQNVYGNYHHSVFDEAFLVSVLRKHGFGHVRRWSPDVLGMHDSSNRAICARHDRVPVSLNMEATKRQHTGDTCLGRQRD